MTFDETQGGLGPTPDRPGGALAARAVAAEPLPAARRAGRSAPGSLAPDDGLTGLTAAALSRAIAARAVSCREVASAYLARIERLDPGLNAIVSLRDPDAISAEARAKDDLLARGEHQGWMHGFPHAVKDLAATKGLRTTQGSALHRDTIPARDALFVGRMKAAGAIAGRGMDTCHRWMEVAIFATMAGCPAINAPAGLSADGLPMGLQIIAPPHADLACLRIARAYESATDRGDPIPATEPRN